MFKGMHQQNIADYLKGTVLKLPTPDQQREGLAWINRLETAEWHSPAFQQVFDRLGQRYRMENRRLVFDGSPREMLDTLAAIVQGYLNEIEPVVAPNLLTTAEACQYVSDQLTQRGRRLSPSSVKEYIWERKMLRGQRVGNTMLFRQEDLDAFIESYLVLDPKRGRRWHHDRVTENRQPPSRSAPRTAWRRIRRAPAGADTTWPCVPICPDDRRPGATAPARLPTDSAPAPYSTQWIVQTG